MKMDSCWRGHLCASCVTLLGIKSGAPGSGAPLYWHNTPIGSLVLQLYFRLIFHVNKQKCNGETFAQLFYFVSGAMFFIQLIRGTADVENERVLPIRRIGSWLLVSG